MRWLEKQRQPFLQNWYVIHGVGFFVVLCLLYISLNFVSRILVLDGIAAFEILQERGEMWIFDLFFGLQYASTPLFLAWKITLTSFTLWVGCFMYGYRLTFRELWKMVMVFELVFLVPMLLKILWFILIQSDPNYFEVGRFYPISLINLFNAETLHPRWIYPLKALNLFEVIYWLLLISGIYWLSGKKLSSSVQIVASSYIILFLLWLAFYLLSYR